MLELFKSEPEYEIQPVRLNGVDTAFVCREALAVGKEARVVDTEGCKATVEVSGVRRLEEGAWLHFGSIVSGDLEALTPWPEGLRENPRLKVGLRVRSEELPEYSALSTDLSMTGVQLEAVQPLSVGEELPLVLDLDHGDDSLAVKAVVRWAQLSAPYRAGLQFVALSPEIHYRLRSFLSRRVDLDQALPSLNTSASQENSHEEGPEAMELLDAYQQNEHLQLTTRSSGKILRYIFTRPVVTTSKLSKGVLICGMECEPLGQNLHRFRWLDRSGECLLELEGPSPEVVSSVE